MLLLKALEAQKIYIFAAFLQCYSFDSMLAAVLQLLLVPGSFWHWKGSHLNLAALLLQYKHLYVL